MSDNDKELESAGFDYRQFFTEEFRWDNISASDLFMLLRELSISLASTKGYAEMIVQAENSDQPLKLSNGTSITIRECAQQIVRSAERERLILDAARDGFRQWSDQNNPPSE